MFLGDKGYAIKWALAGVTHPRKTMTFLRERREADRLWEADRPQTITDLGTVSRLSILPLIEHYAVSPEFATEPGVSYLIRADDSTILFDTGFNVKGEHPSALLKNMERLGIDPTDIDAVFITHLHADHVGGVAAELSKTFTVSGRPVDLGGVPAYVPTAMTHPTTDIQVVTEPRKLWEGVASSGPIHRAIWWTGGVAEQVLLVDVAQKGMVMIVGCGHPSLARMIERARAVTGTPLYGVVGGLHFPVTGSRMGRGMQTIIGNGKLPWQRITRREALEAARMLAGLDLGLVALSAHDSCDWTIDAFKHALGDIHRTVRVGEEIVVSA